MVTTKQNQVAYCDIKGNITYTESTDPLYNEAICKFNDGFARMRRSGMFYFINEFGKPIFSSAYEKAEDFEEGLAQIKQNGKWGFINQKGEIVINPQFYETHPFSSGLSQVTYGATKKYGYIDSTGNFVIKPQFDMATAFTNDRAWVSVNGKWGLINREGKFIINPVFKLTKYTLEDESQWSWEYNFNYVTIIRKQKLLYDHLTWTLLDKKWGLVNNNGVTLINHQFSDVKDISEGYTWVKQGELWGMVDSLGNHLIKPDERNPLIYASNTTFKLFSTFHDGLMLYQSRSLFGFLDKNLRVVIPAKYDKVTDFKNGLACVKQDDYWGIIDLKGNIIIPINYKEIIINDTDLFSVKDDNGDWGYLNIKNEWVIKPQFKKVTPFVLTTYN
ncbi:MAG: WG repeat-containing protein [Bacteroidetes bacterium]|nr:WG repeat-containing protein [Bacteroidota bacterium]